MANALAMIQACGQNQHGGRPRWACTRCEEPKDLGSTDPMCAKCRADVTELDREIRCGYVGYF